MQYCITHREVLKYPNGSARLLTRPNLELSQLKASAPTCDTAIIKDHPSNTNTNLYSHIAEPPRLFVFRFVLNTSSFTLRSAGSSSVASTLLSKH